MLKKSLALALCLMVSTALPSETTIAPTHTESSFDIKSVLMFSPFALVWAFCVYQISQQTALAQSEYSKLENDYTTDYKLVDSFDPLKTSKLSAEELKSTQPAPTAKSAEGVNSTQPEPATKVVKKIFDTIEIKDILTPAERYTPTPDNTIILPY